MSAHELFSILPLLIISAGIVLLLLQVSFWRNHIGSFITTLVTLVFAILSCFWVAASLSGNAGSIQVTSLINIDYNALFFSLLLLLTAMVVSIMGYNYLEPRCYPKRNPDNYPEEFYILVLLAILGALTLVCSSHFATFFLGIELISLALYPLLGFTVTGNLSSKKEQLDSLESAFKYLILSALSTALGLFGIALIYAASGALDFDSIAIRMPDLSQTSALFATGTTLLIISIAFKLSLVPFHIWTPDVFQGAPTPVTALIATVGKTAAIAFLLRFFNTLNLYQSPVLIDLLTITAIASMLIGNLLALMQNNVKRLLAYSSIGHIGYLIVAFIIGNSAFGTEAVIYYLVAYVITTLGSFAIVGLIADSVETDQLSRDKKVISPPEAKDDPYQREFYRGLLWRSPWLAICLALMLLSLAGIPLTIGFIGKFYIFSAGVEGQMWALLAGVVIGSALGLFYYLRLLLTMVQRDISENTTNFGALQITTSGQLLIATLAAALVLFGIFPQILINWINTI
ncbi:NADH-quinone oxidoreductase subunit N [Microbulbifer sp. OS29]|uniref:NADH-quinone oxidoreductase subunit N n=1 Tax=Microbulbifer okhotskensis TaxID=2926617 RepID=A0A9X2EP10_9GAMM|nr:NADH-quinone oxidoreductase subunit N [Microbulbifer okhotskensis]MCO1335169.1 NADH-quinone oxidoreductase subunit N [Microbulbifer okhotskensis]